MWDINLNQFKKKHFENKLNFSLYKTLPLVLQSESSECGLACILMISKYYGFDTDMNRLRQNFSISKKGVGLQQLINIATSISLLARPVKLGLDNLGKLQVPCILHWDMKHFVVLKKVTRSKIIIHDPAVGVRSIPINEASDYFTGVAIEITPSNNFQPKVTKQLLTFRDFWSKIHGFKASFTMLLSISLLLQLIAIISPFFLQVTIDSVIYNEDIELLLVLALGFVLLLLLECFTFFIREISISRLSHSVNIQVLKNVFNHFIRLPVSYYEKRSDGDILSRFESIIPIQDILTKGLITISVDGLMALITLIAMFLYSPQITCIVLVIVLMYFGIRLLLYKPIILLNSEKVVAQAKNSSHLLESIRAIQTIKLFEKEQERTLGWENTLVHSVNKEIRLSLFKTIYVSLNRLLFGIENILLIYIAALEIIEGNLTVGMLYAFITYKLRFVSSVQNLIDTFFDYKMLATHLERLSDIVFTKKEENSYIQSPTNSDYHLGDVSVRDLKFSYGSQEPPIFTDLNLDITKGETIAIIGPSGSGKSTLLKCLMGLLQPDEGSISVGGINIKDMQSFRSNISGISQDGHLLSGTITENISCFAAKINFDKVLKYSKMSCIHSEIMQMPMQYNSLIGDIGSSLSGGQKQRILLARALYREPQILFMDEATSHLDENNEKEINLHIKNLEITRIIIAHRKETIKLANKVYLLKNGKLEILEQ